MTVRIANNLPYKDRGKAVEGAVLEGIGERPDVETWKVYIFEPQIPHRYTITIEGPNQLNWE